jgi:Ca2+-binding RTX toxin-like protein
MRSFSKVSVGARSVILKAATIAQVTTATFLFDDGSSLLLGTALADSLSGTAFSDQIQGFNGNDSLTGGGAADKLYGGEGNDTLDGGAGADTMTGGNGNDVYYVDASGDSVVESSTTGGTDTVIASVSHVLARNVDEYLRTAT